MIGKFELMLLVTYHLKINCLLVIATFTVYEATLDITYNCFCLN